MITVIMSIMVMMVSNILTLNGGFRWGHSRLVPPLLKHFSINAPPF